MGIALPGALALLCALPLGCSDDSAAPPAWLVDVASDAGLVFRHDNGARGRSQLPEIMGAGCAWIDHDGDGDPDAYLVSSGRGDGARNRLFENRAGRFVDISSGSGAADAGFGMGCAVGDYDADGDPDIYVTNFGANVLLRNDGGRFTDVTASAGVGESRWSASAAFADLNGDGVLDLFVTNYMDHPERSTRSCFDAAGRVEYCGPHSHFPPIRDTLYFGNGDGTFTDASAASGIAGESGYGLGVCVADFDRDGHADVYVANDATPNHLWVNDGTGHFSERAAERGAAFNAHGQSEAGMGVQAEDIDGDGGLEILVSNLVNETNTLYRGDGRGRFDDVTALSGLAAPSLAMTGFGLGLFDVDHDGELDLFVTNGRIRRGPRVGGVALPAPWDRYAERDQLFTGLGASGSPRAPRFEERSREAGLDRLAPALGRGLALADFDGDGDLDLLATYCGGAARLLRNDAPKRGRWLAVRVLDARGGDAYGATVSVRPAGVVAGETRHWTRRVQPAYSYLSSSTATVHFGIGAVDSVDVTVRWPDGVERRLDAALVDRVLTVSRDTASGSE